MNEQVRAAVGEAMDRHRRHERQQDVWLPQIRCMCGEVMMSNRYRAHLADMITGAVMEALP